MLSLKIGVMKMKQLEKFFSHACMYTVFISIAFYIFSDMVNTKGLSMSFGRFLTIFAFSMMISSMEYIFSVTRIPKILKYLIHYLILCIAFNVVFLSIRKSNSDFVFNSSTIFAAIVLFSFGYAAFFLFAYLFKKLGAKINFNKSRNASKKDEYKSRFQ